MGYDPLTEGIDEPLTVDAAVVDGLRKFRAASKLSLLPGVDPRIERERLSKILDDLADRLTGLCGQAAQRVAGYLDPPAIMMKTGVLIHNRPTLVSS
jgi:hypothetical protein